MPADHLLQHTFPAVFSAPYFNRCKPESDMGSLNGGNPSTATRRLLPWQLKSDLHLLPYSHRSCTLTGSLNLSESCYSLCHRFSYLLRCSNFKLYSSNCQGLFQPLLLRQPFSIVTAVLIYHSEYSQDTHIIWQEFPNPLC